MRNARKYNDRITIGGVPDSDDLAQLKDLGYKTLIDLREDSEKFGGLVQKRAETVGLRYINIPISRQGIDLHEVARFYECLYEKGSAPIYTFSRLGRKPMAFLLLFDGVAKHERHLIPKIIKQAGQFGINLEGDVVLQKFLVDTYNRGEIEAVVKSIRKLRPDLLGDGAGEDEWQVIAPRPAGSVSDESQIKMKTVVIGLGNSILSDDSVGPRVAEELRGLLERSKSDVEIAIEEANVGGLGLMDIMVGYDRAIIIDAIQTVNGTPGEIYRLDLTAFERSRRTGPVHDFDLLSALEIGKLDGMELPHTIDVFAIEAADVSTFSEECTPEVRKAIPICVEMIRREIEGESNA